MIAAVIVLCVAVGISLTFAAPKYAADGAIRIQPGMGAMYRTSPMSMLSGEASSKIASEVTVMQSRTVYLDVARQLNLVDEPAFWGKRSLKSKLSLDDPLTRENVVRNMRQEVKIDHNPKDEIITLSCKTQSPVLSAKIVNAIINDYVEYIFKMRYGASQRASGWLIGQLDDLKRQIEKDQSDLISLQSKVGAIGIGEKDSTLLSAESLTELTRASTSATIERILAEARLRHLQESDPSLIEGELTPLSQQPAGAPNGLLSTLRTSLGQASANYARLIAQFGPNYPEVKEAKAQLDELTRQVSVEEQRILNQAQLSFNSASSNERMTNEALAKQKGEAASSNDDLAKYIILLHDYESHRTLYEGLVLRLREAGITSGMDAGDVDVVDLADVPAIAAPPGPPVFIGASIIAGIVLGCLVAFLMEALKSRITSLDEAERIVKLPLLALLPHIPQKVMADRSNPLLIGTDSFYAESLQTARTAILMSRPGEHQKVIVVTSAVPAEGKSTISMNLSATFAQHHGKVLLIDCDLRKGELARRFQVPGSIGLSNVLTDSATFEEALRPLENVTGLYFIPGGPRPPNPAVLMDSQQMQQLLERARKEFDIIILDCPPVLGISDTLNVGQFADALLLIVRENASSRKAVQHVQRQIAAARLSLMGFIYNDVDSVSVEYGYGLTYRYYGNSYGYGYGDREKNQHRDGGSKQS